MGDDGLLSEEEDVMNALVLAVEHYQKLPIQHPDEPRDFANAIHQCQQLLALRVVRREHDGWENGTIA